MNQCQMIKKQLLIGGESINRSILYDSGNENIPLTGGWILFPDSDQYGEMRKTSDYIELINTSKTIVARSIYIHTNNLIDLTGFSKLYATFSVNGSSYVGVHTQSSISNHAAGIVNGKWFGLFTNVDNITQFMDIIDSSLLYVTFRAQTNTKLATIFLHKLWLE